MTIKKDTNWVKIFNNYEDIMRKNIDQSQNALDLIIISYKITRSTFYKKYKEYVNQGKPQDFTSVDNRKNKPRLMPDFFDELLMIKTINRIRVGRNPTILEFQNGAKELHEALVKIEDREDYIYEKTFSLMNFEASRSWVAAILTRYRFTLRKTNGKHGKKIVDLTDPNVIQALEEYQKTLNDFVEKYGISRLVNFDESYRNGLTRSTNVIASKDTRDQPSSQDMVKSDGRITIVSTITGDGKTLPTKIICKGTGKDINGKLFEKYGDLINEPDLRFSSSPSGWSNKDETINTLTMISEYFEGKRCGVILDNSPTHGNANDEDDIVRMRANELNIELIYMPANLTHVAQPADIGYFGQIKSMADKRWMECGYNRPENFGKFHYNQVSVILHAIRAVTSASIIRSFMKILTGESFKPVC